MEESQVPSQIASALLERGHPEPCAGDVVAERYLLLAELGRGSLGPVFEAESLRSGKRVALKWLSAAGSGEVFQARFVRFQREGRAIAQICHPNLADVYDLGEQAGTPFLVTERLYGETLRARLARGPLGWDEARRVLAGVLRGLSVAHAAGVVHRELKPENVFLCLAERGLAPVPKLIDFGVACLRPAPDAASTSAGRGPPAAAPAYLALEQLTGDPLDGRSDVYAAGVVLYEALTSKLPFQARGAAEFAVLQATTAPARPSLELPALAGARERVLLRALRAAREARYSDAAAFAAALEDRPRGADAGLVRTLGAAGLLVCASYALYAEQGASWNGSPPASGSRSPSATLAPAHTGEPPSATSIEAMPTDDPARAAPPKPSKRWLAYRLAVTRGAEATRALQDERAAQGQLATQTSEPSGEAAPAVPRNPYAIPAAESNKDL
jgi:serine/threonine protein kinase